MHLKTIIYAVIVEVITQCYTLLDQKNKHEFNPVTKAKENVEKMLKDNQNFHYKEAFEAFLEENEVSKF